MMISYYAVRLEQPKVSIAQKILLQMQKYYFLA